MSFLCSIGIHIGQPRRRVGHEFYRACPCGKKRKEAKPAPVTGETLRRFIDGREKYCRWCDLEGRCINGKTHTYTEKGTVTGNCKCSCHAGG